MKWFQYWNREGASDIEMQRNASCGQKWLSQITYICFSTVVDSNLILPEISAAEMNCDVYVDLQIENADQIESYAKSAIALVGIPKKGIGFGASVSAWGSYQ